MRTIPGQCGDARSSSGVVRRENGGHSGQATSRPVGTVERKLNQQAIGLVAAAASTATASITASATATIAASAATTAVAAAASTAATTTTAAAAFLAGTRLVHGDVPALQIGPVKGVDGLVATTRHFHEPEAARAALRTAFCAPAAPPL